jgi:hypothetical protein
VRTASIPGYRQSHADSESSQDSAAPAPPRLANPIEFTIHFCLGSLRNPGDEPVKVGEHAAPLGLAEFPDAQVTILYSLANNFTLRNREALRRVIEASDTRARLSDIGDRALLPLKPRIRGR